MQKRSRICFFFIRKRVRVLHVTAQLPRGVGIRHFGEANFRILSPHRIFVFAWPLRHMRARSCFHMRIRAPPQLA
jgi:hypothetical protein